VTTGDGKQPGKRAMDLVLVGAALLVTCPVQALAALVIWLRDGRPILFRQQRAGLGGGPFALLKFRSMRVTATPAELLGQVGIDHALVTATGRLLRRWKIDELPQLLNILRGDMSFVGPRPTLVEQVAAYDELGRRRLLVRPGLTGWAQVNGNVALTWPERILLDVWYVDHWSLGLDARILLRTIGVVARGERPDIEALEEARAHAADPGRRR
jgi:lipopolysaccharide/colanic/teichoic acid biosynthesis glycosyltransferase